MIIHKLTIDDILRVHSVDRERFYARVGESTDGEEGIERRRSCQIIYGNPCSRQEIVKVLNAANSLLRGGKTYDLNQVRWREALPS